jgi:ribonuclease HIII
MVHCNVVRNETKELSSMNRTFSLLFILSALVTGCGTFDSTQTDKRDFAVDTFYLTSNEMQLAERHARQYRQENLARLGAEPRYLAITASSILAAELNAESSIKLDRSETSGSYFTQGISSSSKQGLHGIMLFDTQTDRSVGSQGYIVVDTPHRGQIIRIAEYTARYIGGG